MYTSPSIKWIILVVLVVQTTLTVLLMRYSLTHSTTPYLSTALVFSTECFKYILSLIILIYQNDFSVRKTIEVYLSEIIEKPRQTALLSVPAFLYTLQNNLLILALKNLNAATFQITYQLKIITTAGFSVILLNRDLTRVQWSSLVLLTAGVALVQWPANASSSSANNLAQDKVTGLVAVLVACFSSGFAGVFYEKLLKTGSQPSIIIRNLQLGIFAVMISLCGLVGGDWKDIMEKGLFCGFNVTVWVIVVLQSMGGLVVAATIKYADNILKGFATSLSILMSGLVSWLVLGDLEPGLYFLTGTTMVLFSSALYCYKPTLNKVLPI